MKLISLVILSMLLTGCIVSYGDIPKDAASMSVTPGKCDVMYYNVKKFNILDSGGFQKLNDTFNSARPCKSMKPSNQVAEKGLFVDVETEWRPMSLPALIFGYLSVSTLTILPAWSTQDGYMVRYQLYRDGKKLDSYQYDINRKLGLWLGLLPFAWVNFMTSSETDAFEATTYRFFKEAQQHFDSSAGSAVQ